jgi:hypothetical protein
MLNLVYYLFSIEFMIFFGLIFIVSTTLILLFKKESTFIYQYDQELNEDKLSVSSTFGSLFDIIKLAPVRKLIWILLTAKVTINAIWNLQS